MWTTLKNVSDNREQQQPTTIFHNNTFISSPRALANLANAHYIRKINTIREFFKLILVINFFINASLKS